MKSDNVRVHIRIRPISTKEIDEGKREIKSPILTSVFRSTRLSPRGWSPNRLSRDPVHLRQGLQLQRRANWNLQPDSRAHAGEFARRLQPDCLRLWTDWLWKDLHDGRRVRKARQRARRDSPTSRRRYIWEVSFFHIISFLSFHSGLTRWRTSTKVACRSATLNCTKKRSGTCWNRKQAPSCSKWEKSTVTPLSQSSQRRKITISLRILLVIKGGEIRVRASWQAERR